MSIKKINILGAGTAGLVSALVLKTYNKELDISIIKSKKIDIVGVGEGSTEHWAAFIDYIDVNIVEFFKHTDCTYKHGIMFENWNGDQSNYMHNVNTFFMQQDNTTGYPFLQHLKIVTTNTQLETLDPNTVLSKHYQPVARSTNQFHFDTFKLNEYLIKICKDKQINIIEDTISEVSINNSGIESLKGETNNYIADLYIDASGFNRVLLSKLGAVWVDCTEYLPMNSAITFPTTFKENEEYPGYTRAIAMNAGWIWQIPTQKRYGNGYVFCDKFITEEEALAEAEELYQQKLTINKSFKFGAGYIKDVWIKNCVAIGLSASFVEPLEATNIGTGIQQAFALITHLETQDIAEESKMMYNKIIRNIFKNTIDFVQLHYITKREDTNFWKFCKTIKKTEFNKRTLEVFKNSMPTWQYFSEPYILFNHQNWIPVLNGLELIDRQKYIDNWNKISYNKRMETLVKSDIYDNRPCDVLNNRDAIEFMRNSNVAN